MLYYNSNQTSATYEFGRQLFQMIASKRQPGQPLIFLCIGSDRATGDSLGPIVGQKLYKHKFPNLYIYGTLEYPVHAKNLEETLRQIRLQFHPLLYSDKYKGNQPPNGCCTIYLKMRINL